MKKGNAAIVMRPATEEMKNNHSRRGPHARDLAALWVQSNRPDVWLACKEEAAKKYPPQKMLAALPESLSRIKS